MAGRTRTVPNSVQTVAGPPQNRQKMPVLPAKPRNQCSAPIASSTPFGDCLSRSQDVFSPLLRSCCRSASIGCHSCNRILHRYRRKFWSTPASSSWIQSHRRHGLRWPSPRNSPGEAKPRHNRALSLRTSTVETLMELQKFSNMHSKLRRPGVRGLQPTPERVELCSAHCGVGFHPCLQFGPDGHRWLSTKTGTR